MVAQTDSHSDLSSHISVPAHSLTSPMIDSSSPPLTSLLLSHFISLSCFFFCVSPSLCLSPLSAAHVPSWAHYLELHDRSIQSNDQFWKEVRHTREGRGTHRADRAKQTTITHHVSLISFCINLLSVSLIPLRQLNH